MADVFISYSRKDTDFVKQIFSALQAQQREAWVDWQGIDYSTRWWEEICAGIEGADHFVLIISPDSLNSVYCHREIEHAYKCKKRMIPMVYRSVNEAETVGRWYTNTDLRPIETLARQNWEIIKGIQWIDYPNLGSFEQALNQLIQTIDTDPERVRLHTRLLLRVRDWEIRGRSPSAFLRGDELVAYETWLKQSISDHIAPYPTDEQQEYIKASRRYEEESLAKEQARITEDEKRIAALHTATEQATRTRQQLTLTIGVAALIIIAAIAAALLGLQGQQAASERADHANTAVMVAGEALTPIPVTLTNVANRVLAGQSTLDVVAQQLTEIPPTTTQLAMQLIEVSQELAKNGVYICPGASRPVFTRVKLGSFGRITAGDPSRIRSGPSITTPVLGQISANSIVKILDGPICGDSKDFAIAWWKVDYDGLIGWTAEALNNVDRWIEPLTTEVPAIPTLSTAECYARLPSRLVVGGLGRVLPGGANALNTQPERANKDLLSRPITGIPAGAVFTVLDGPSCDEEGFVWWHVKYGIKVGWTPEGSPTDGYWIEPVS